MAVSTPVDFIPVLLPLFTKGGQNSTESRRRFEDRPRVSRVPFFLFLSLSLRLPPLFLSQSFYFSRDSHLGRTGGGLEGEEDSLSLEDPADYTDVGLQARSVPRLSYTQRRKCWNSSGANSTTKDECRGCLDKSIISSARVVPV